MVEEIIVSRSQPARASITRKTCSSSLDCKSLLSVLWIENEDVSILVIGDRLSELNLNHGPSILYAVEPERLTAKD